MSENRWIISKHKFYEHKTYESMQTELERLQLLHPDRHFRVYRIKNDPKSATSPVESVEDQGVPA